MPPYESKSVGFTVRLGDLTTEDRVFSAGGLRRQVVVRKIGNDYPWKVLLPGVRVREGPPATPQEYDM